THHLCLFGLEISALNSADLFITILASLHMPCIFIHNRKIPEIPRIGLQAQRKNVLKAHHFWSISKQLHQKHFAPPSYDFLVLKHKDRAYKCKSFLRSGKKNNGKHGHSLIFLELS
uniref:Uncharacterized protein n=1 Tax=Scleropages formosus TaxID=113540 RepID=A0A8C9RTS7_SCLFO